ncbi:MAG: High-affnity carbon uptake protein Hat/HatR [Cyclobacteriaceae bacterium]
MKNSNTTYQTGVLSKVTANPFPGLRPFKIEESHLFFGREGQSDEVLLKLSKNRFIGVIGPSGSGKSSFIYCGVLPILYGGFLTEISPNWEVVVSRPGAGPIENLAQSLLEHEIDYKEADAEKRQIKKTIVTTLLRSSSLGLVEAILQSRRSEDKNYLILIDQFEELFRFKEHGDASMVNEALAFVNLLIEAINYSDAPIYVAITMRSDFIGECAQFSDLTKKINDSHYLIPQMTREQKRRAIIGPVAVGGSTITQRLVQLLLNDLGDTADQLPILQHALMRTWSYWQNNQEYSDEPLDIRHYEAIGTMSEALSMHANEAYDELDDTQKIVCEKIFKAITEKRGDSFGVRRPTRLGDIAAITEVSEADVIEVIDKFREPSRSLLTPAYSVPLNSQSMIDISHESLMRIWIRLKNWVDDESEAVQMYLRLSEAAAMYQVGKAALWRPPDLQLALNWKEKHKPTLLWGQRHHVAFERTMTFLEYSERDFQAEQRIKELQQKQRLRNARITALVLATATLISILFLIYAFYQQTQAEQARLAAIANEKQAIANEELALANEKEALYEKERAEINAREALEQKSIADKERLRAEENLILANEQTKRAIAGEALARENERIAIMNEKLALENEQRAERERLIAIEAKARADRLRYLAIAKAMSIKSTQFRNEQKDIKGLLAQQAYMFNTFYKGDEYDNDIYNGLYEALKSVNDPLVENLAGHNKGVRAVTSNKSGNYIYSSDTQGKILRWTLQNNTRVADTLIGTRTNHVIRALSASEDNKWLAAGGEFSNAGNTYLELFDISQSNAAPKRINGYKGHIWNVIFSPDSKGIFTLDNQGRSIKYYDFKEVKEVANTNVQLNDLTLTSNGSWLLGAGNDGKVYLFDVKNGFKQSEIFSNNIKLVAIASGSGNSVVVGDESGILTYFTLFSMQPAKALLGHTSPITDLSFSHDDRFIASASRDKTVKLWNRQNLNAQPINLKDHPTWVWTVAFSPDNNQLLAGTQETIVKTWATHIEAMADKLCQTIDRNMTLDEWHTFVGNDPDLIYQKTCNDNESPE